MFFTALMSIVQSAIQATVIHSFCLHCGTHSKFIWGFRANCYVHHPLWNIM